MPPKMVFTFGSEVTIPTLDVSIPRGPDVADTADTADLSDLPD